MKPKFKMMLTDGGFELVDGKWPTKAGQLWNGLCLVNGEERKCQAAGGRFGPTFYWGW